jgi:hypothetical protein
LAAWALNGHLTTAHETSTQLPRTRELVTRKTRSSTETRMLSDSRPFFSLRTGLLPGWSAGGADNNSTQLQNTSPAPPLQSGARFLQTTAASNCLRCVQQPYMGAGCVQFTLLRSQQRRTVCSRSRAKHRPKRRPAGARSGHVSIMQFCKSCLGLLCVSLAVLRRIQQD